MLLSLTGCANVIHYILPVPAPKDKIQMTVAPTSRPGVYTVIGTSNLPDKSRVAVAAIRYLRPTNADSLRLNSNNLTYSVIAYQNADVKDGKWQANINLWQVAPDGQYKEAWQLEHPKLKVSLEPIKEITFVATVSRADQSQKIMSTLNRQIDRLATTFVKFTDEGERYVNVSKIMPVDLPSGKTTPPAAKPEDFNFGWGDRYVIKPELPNTIELKVTEKERDRINTPLSPGEFMR